MVQSKQADLAHKAHPKTKKAERARKFKSTESENPFTAVHERCLAIKYASPKSVLPTEPSYHTTPAGRLRKTKASYNRPEAYEEEMDLTKKEAMPHMFVAATMQVCDAVECHCLENGVSGFFPGDECEAQTSV